MVQRTFPSVLLAVLSAALGACGSESNPALTAAGDGGAPEQLDDARQVGSGDGAALYAPLHVAQIQLEVTEEDLAILRADADQPMGFEDFTYVPARLNYDGIVFEQVGLRVKGNNSRTTASGDAVPFKLDMNRYVSGVKLDGQTKINLHNNVNQPAAMNEYLSYGAFRDYNVPASRTGWADITLNGSSLGLYTLVEQVSEKFLARFYGDPQAPLYKPESPAGYLDYLGDTIDAYEGLGYEADGETDHASFLQLTKALSEQPVSTWDAYIDLTSVLTYFAGNVALRNWDTYTAMGHNYYLFEASAGRFVMLPWDLNLSQAASSAVCPAEVQRSGGGGNPSTGGGRRSLELPSGVNVPMGGGPGGGVGGAGPGRSNVAPLHDGLMADDSQRARYLELLQGFLAGPGSVAALDAQIDAVLPVLGERVTAAAVADLRATIAARVQAITRAIPTTASCALVRAQ